MSRGASGTTAQKAAVTIMVAETIIGPNILPSPPPLNSRTSRGGVNRSRLSVPTMRGQTSWFQCATTLKIAKVGIAGIAVGRLTRQTIANSLFPSLLVASIKSSGPAMKNGRIGKMPHTDMVRPITWAMALSVALQRPDHGQSPGQRLSRPMGRDRSWPA